MAFPEASFIDSSKGSSKNFEILKPEEFIKNLSRNNIPKVSRKKVYRRTFSIFKTARNLWYLELGKEGQKDCPLCITF